MTIIADALLGILKADVREAGGSVRSRRDHSVTGRDSLPGGQDPPFNPHWAGFLCRPTAACTHVTMARPNPPVPHCRLRMRKMVDNGVIGSDRRDFPRKDREGGVALEGEEGV